jgi:hypothetical protein
MTPDEYREAHGMDDDTEEDAVSDDTRTDDGLAFAITRGNEHRARIATLKAELAEAREQVAIMGGEVDCATMRCMDAEAAHKHAEAKCEWLANECARQCRVWTRKNCVTRDWLAAAESAVTKEAS